MPGQSLNKMIRDQFWDRLRDHSDGIHDTSDVEITDFDEFRVETRKIEMEKSKLAKDELVIKMNKPAQVKMITADHTNRFPDFDELKGMVCQHQIKLIGIVNEDQ